MFNKPIIQNSETLGSVPDWYKTHNMCDKAIDNYVNAL